MGAAALIGAIFGGGLFAAGVTVFGTTLISSALMGAALGSLFDRRTGTPVSPTYDFDELRNTRSQAMPVPIIYGKAKVAGNIIYHRVSDNKKELYMAVGLCEGEIEGVSDIQVDDIPIDEIKGADYAVYLGKPDQTANAWVLTEERFPYTAYLALKFTDQSQVSSSPTITCVVEGRKVPVWDGDAWVTQYSNNPAWCLLDFLRSARYGVGVQDDRLDFEAFKAEALYCDELVDDRNDGQEARFALDYVIDYECPSLDVIDDMLATFQAFVPYTDGKLRLKIEKSESPVYQFDHDNIKEGTFVYSKASRKDIPNQIRIEWIDPDADYERAEAVYDNEIDQDKRGEVYSRTIGLLGVTRASQAGRMARFYHDSAYWANTFCEFRVGIDALHCEVGDVVQVSHDVPGWTKKLFRILEIQEYEDDEAILRCREYAPAIYHDRGITYQPGKETVLPNPVAPPPHVTDLSATSASRTMTDGIIVPVIRVTWSEPSYVYYAGAVVYWKEQSDSAWQQSSFLEAPSYDIILAEAGKYDVRVVSENRNRVRADFATAPEETVTVSTVIPANVTGLAVDFTGPDAIASWNPVPRINKYRVRILDATTDQVKRTVEITGTTFAYTFAMNVADFSTATPSLKVSVEARNEAGNYSDAATILLASHLKPAKPTVQVESSLTQLRWRLTSDLPAGFAATRIQLGSVDQTSPGATSGIIDLVAAGIDDGDSIQIDVSVIDVFGQESDERTASVSALYATEQDLAGSIFEVEYLSDEFPQQADPTVLYDNDFTTGITFAQAPTITVRHPKEERFGMVTLHVSDEVDGYVQVRRHGEENWTSVIGTPGSPHTFDEGENVVAFVGNRIVVAREVRVVLADAVKVNEFTPSVYLVANHILGGTLYATQDVQVVGGDGAVRINDQGAWGYDFQGNKRAGFGTDGRWVAGGGAVVADETGLKVGGSPVASQDYAEPKIHRGSAAPANPDDNDLWLDTSQTPNKWWRYDDSEDEWVPATAADIESIEDIPGAHDFDELEGVAAEGSVHIGTDGIVVEDGKIVITSTDGNTLFLGDRWEVYDDDEVLRVRIGRLDV